MDKVFEICHVQIPYNKILEYRVIDREYIYRPHYYTSSDLFRGKRYVFSHMVPYAAIYAEAEYKSAVKAFKAITLGGSLAQDTVNGILSTIGDKFNIKVWKYSRFTCRNQAGRVFTTYLQDVPASLETAGGKRSEVYPHDELYKGLGEPIAPSIEFVPALLILAKDELFTFYGNGIQVDAEYEYQRLKQGMAEYLQEKEDASSKKSLPKSKSKIPQLAPPRINVSLPQFGKKAALPQSSPIVDYIDAECDSSKQTVFDPMDLNHDGVVDEKDLELLKQMLETKN